MAFENIVADKKSFVFRFDDVIYPEKDYLLQVYYLFAEFMAYSEQIDAKALLDFMQSTYTAEGVIDLFSKTKNRFGLPDRYEENFIRLHANARLPLKLLLYKQVLEFLQEIVLERKSIYLILEGDAATQINKIKQLEWNGLAQYLKLYFTQEFDDSIAQTVEFIVAENELVASEILFITPEESSDIKKMLKSIDTISVGKLLFN